MLAIMDQPRARMPKKSTKQEPVPHARFKAGVPADKRRAVLSLDSIKAKLQEIQDELTKIDALLLQASTRGADSLYLDGAMKAGNAKVELLVFRQKIERALEKLPPPE